MRVFEQTTLVHIIIAIKNSISRKLLTSLGVGSFEVLEKDFVAHLVRILSVQLLHIDIGRLVLK